MRNISALAFAAIVALGTTASAGPKLVDFKSTDGKFAVTAPGNNRNDSKNLAVGATGLTIPVTTDRWDGPSSTVYAVTFADYPDTFREVAAKTILDGVRDGLKGTDGKVALDEKVTLGKGADKIDGREFRIEAGSRTAVRVRVYLVESRLYQVMVTGTKDSVNTKAATEFLNSFKLVK